jgi:hypothetical protein
MAMAVGRLTATALKQDTTEKLRAKNLRMTSIVSEALGPKTDGSTPKNVVDQAIAQRRKRNAAWAATTTARRYRLRPRSSPETTPSVTPNIAESMPAVPAMPDVTERAARANATTLMG